MWFDVCGMVANFMKCCDDMFDGVVAYLVEWYDGCLLVSESLAFA